MSTDSPTPQQILELMPFAQAIGIELVQTEADEVIGRLPWAPDRCTTAGAMHGGAVMSLADTCGGVCAFLNLPEGATGTATVESKTNLLRAVQQGTLIAVSRPLHVGRTLMVVETELTREDGRLAAKVTQTQVFQYPR